MAKRLQAEKLIEQFDGIARAEHAEANACGDHIDRAETSSGLSLTSLSPRIRTVEEALAHGEVDTSIWEVDSYQITSWEVGSKVEAMVGNHKVTVGSCVTPLWRIAIKLRRIVTKTIESGVNLFIERLDKHAPPKPRLSKLKPSRDRHIAEFSIYDHHFGKLAWHPETGNNWDLKIAADVYANAVADMLKYWQGVNIERIVLPIGHDLLHIDNDENKTTRGTPQDVDGRLAKVFAVALESVAAAIHELADRSHVEVLHIPGNHDLKTSWYLAKCLECEFKNHPRVTIDAAPTTRKYRRFGCNLFGYAHGDTVRPNELNSLMASENPTDFGQCDNRQWRLGHYHTKKRINTIASNMLHNTEIIYMPSLTGTDKWHFDQGYVGGRRAAEVWLSSYERGYVGHFSAPIRLGDF